MIKLKNIFYSIENIKLLKDISMNIKEKKIVGIIGANGSGKSTLLKNIYRFLNSDSGKIFIKGKEVTKYSNKELAKELSVLTQKQGMNFNFLVEEIMDMATYIKEKKYKSIEKRKEILKYLSLVGMEKHIDRDFFSLSGGEIQRVLIARTIFQGSDILILDEPTNHLDIRYQIQIMDLLKTLNKTILMVLHDINLASYYCDYIYAMKNGKILYEGEPEKILVQKMIKDIYEIDCNIIKHPIRNKNIVIF